MAASPVELRKMWIDAVCRMSGATPEQYRLGRRWDPVFSEVSRTLAQNPQVDPVRYMEAQIQWAIERRVRNSLWPNILCGERAMRRYQRAPDDEEIVLRLEAKFLTQATAFMQVVSHVGLEEALRDPQNAWSPLYLAYVRYENQLEIPQALRALAFQEAQAEPLVSRVFPEKFLRALA